MDLKLIISTFVLIFLAELGDKTQLTAMAASAGCNKPLSVLLGASLALVFSSVLAVAIGSLIGGHFPIKYIKLTAGVLFIVFGILYIKEAFVPEKTGAEQPAASISFMGESEKETICRALEKCNGVLGGKSGAACLLGIPRSTLQYRMKKLGIKPRKTLSIDS